MSINFPVQVAEAEKALGEEYLGVEEEKESEDSEMLSESLNPFDPSKIKVSTEKKTIHLLMSRIAHGEVDLAPEFQRRARLWPIKRKSQLIESLLLRIPLPVFYVAANFDDDWVVVDGLQRITTIFDYLSGEFSLKGMEYLQQLEGMKFSELDRSMQRRISETELIYNVIQPGTPDEVMMNIFRRINTGGMPLNGQEIRNAINKGSARGFLESLASSPEFADATDRSVKDYRMDAQEMVLRFMAFRCLDWNDYKSLDSFLNIAMKKLSSMTEGELGDLAILFKKAMVRSRLVFGAEAFRKPKVRKRNPISKPLFEGWSVLLSLFSDDEFSEILVRKDSVMQAFKSSFDTDQEFVNSVTYSTGLSSRVYKRFETLSRILRNK